jgi:hypothetical protein
LHYFEHFANEPSQYHSIATFLYEAIQKSSQRFVFLHELLHQVSFTLAGAKSIIVSNSEPLVRPLKADVSYRSATGIIAGCCEIIQVFRRILAEQNDSESYTLLIDLIRFILLHGIDGKMSARFQDFENPLYLYGVFAIFSNALDVIRPWSLLKDTSSNAIYYVVKIDYLKQEYEVWQIPITESSAAIKFPFSKSLVPVAMIAFSPSLYDEVDLLLPYFVNVLTARSYAPTLSVLISSTLREFASHPKVISSLTNNMKQFMIPSVFCGNSQSRFLHVLKQLLTQKCSSRSCDGEVKFFCFSPCELGPNAEISDNTFISHSGVNIFISTFLPSQTPSTLEITVNNPDDAFDIGVYSPGIEECGADQNMLSARNGKIGTEIIKRSQSFTVRYDPALHSATIYSGGTHKLNTVEVFSSSQAVCFLVILQKESSLDYQLSAAELSSILPLVGKTVFKRRFQKAANREIPSSPIQIETTAGLRRFNWCLEELSCPLPPRIAIGEPSEEVLVLYPYAVMRSLAAGVLPRPDESLKNQKPIIGVCPRLSHRRCLRVLMMTRRSATSPPMTGNQASHSAIESRARRGLHPLISPSLKFCRPSRRRTTARFLHTF